MSIPFSPINLEDCLINGAGSELFLVEGESAALGVVRARNRQTQAVLPMQGKPLNAWKATRDRVAKFELFQKLTQAIGAGWGESFSIERVRYERILLLFDPDADGIHCGALMTMFFYRWMRPLLDSQRIVIVHPPLIKLTSRRLKNPAFAYTEDDYQRAVRFFKEKGVSDVSVSRYRGLASLDEETLVSSCLRPETRRSSTVTIADAESAIAIFGPSSLRQNR
jgi:DNA gyrase subunit B